MVDRRGTNPSSAAGHFPTQHHQQLHPRETPLVAGPLDPQGTDRAGQSGEDGHVRKRLVLVSTKSAGMKYFQLWPQRGHSRFAEQCQGLHREIPRGSRAGSENSISRQQMQAKREKKR